MAGVRVGLTPAWVTQSSLQFATLAGGEDLSLSGNYEIYVRGRLGPELLHALADLEPEILRESTRLRLVDDQPSLHGILARLWNLGLEIDAIVRVRSSSPEKD